MAQEIAIFDIDRAEFAICCTTKACASCSALSGRPEAYRRKRRAGLAREGVCHRAGRF
jgi:hypothetical protein